jgi:hypothetical protein
MEGKMNPRRHSPSVLLGKVMAVFLLATLPAVAQQQVGEQIDQQPQQQAPQQQQTPPANPNPAASPSDQSKPDDKKTPDQKKDQQPDQNANGNQPSGTSDASQPAPVTNDRLFYALPNFLTVENANQLPPLTVGEKFKEEVRSQFDLIEFPWYGVLAAISQAENSEPGYGQGAQGYAKRYGAAWGDGGIENFMTGAVFPSLLKQDPRYFQLGKGSFWRRTRYALGRILITRTDSGNNQFNYSEIFGSALSASISTYSYHPHGDKTLSNTASVWGTQVALDAITYVVKEFWPDIRKRMSHNKQPDTTTP